MHEVTKSYLCEAFMEWAGLESMQSTPRNITVPTLHSPQEKKVKFLNETIGAFVDEYILPEFHVEKVWRLHQKQKTQQRNQQEGIYLYIINKATMIIMAMWPLACKASKVKQSLTKRHPPMLSSLSLRLRIPGVSMPV